MRRSRNICFILFLLFAIFNSLSCIEIHNPCRFKEFRCEGGTACLSTEKLCNGVEDCPNGEDERGNEQYNCTRVTLSDRCEPGEFRCRFGGCIPKELTCDGIPSCWGGTDESIEFCQALKSKPERPKPQPPRPRPINTQPPDTYPTTRRISTFATTQRTTASTTFKTFTTQYVPPSPTTPWTTSTLRTTTRRRQSNTCPPFEEIEGQRVYCYDSKFAREVDCLQDDSPEGTTADISCKDYYVAPAIGSSKMTKVCKKGQWKGGRRNFWCDLDCGNGGYKPVGFLAGGSASIRGKWPWNAGIYESDPPGSTKFKHICGATLISQKAIITAAHCVTITQTNEPKNVGDLLIFLGKFNRTAENNDHNVQQFSIAKIFIHPKYNFANLDSDIAILWLDRDINTSPYVHPSCLPTREEDFDAPIGDVGWLAGWGSIGEGIYPEELHETELPVVSSNHCRKLHPSLHALVTTNTFCAGFDNGTSACDGDSGGGLVFLDERVNRWKVLGVVSGGVQGLSGQGCDPNFYTVFTNVAKYRIWVHHIMDLAFRRTNS